VTIIDNSRTAALDLLRLVRDEGAYANLALSQVLKKHALNGRDAAFTVELAYGVLRNQLLYDTYIQQCSQREISTIEPEITDVLRMGVHQIVSMRVPDHAAVDSSVNLARGISSGGQAQARAGFVNAILRCVARNHDAGFVPQSDVSIAYSHPQWIIDAYRDSLIACGRDESELENLLQANNLPAKPVVAVRFDDPEIDGTSPGRWSKNARVLDSVIPQELVNGMESRIIVQDEGSQLVAQAFLLATPSGPESAWLDMCAGPGGKAALIADSVPQGVTFTAVELHEHRARLVKQVVTTSATVVVADARNRPWGNLFFDRVLVDAPCTGLGALRRRPEARWRKNASDLYGLNALQEELLLAALDSTRSGGIVCYVTCSPHVEETRDILRTVLAERPDAHVEDARPLFPGVTDLGPGPIVQLWPHIHGTDAMFFALIRRN
jgi:16S rRNA (cytosine967-C5)-methyltransferase